jgi:hypothetical protein
MDSSKRAMQEKAPRCGAVKDRCSATADAPSKLSQPAAFVYTRLGCTRRFQPPWEKGLGQHKASLTLARLHQLDAIFTIFGAAALPMRTGRESRSQQYR